MTSSPRGQLQLGETAMVPRAAVQHPKPVGGEAIASNLTGVHTDLELRSILDSNRHRTVFVDFGSSFCTHCRSVLPHFLAASRERPQQQFVVASVDYMLIEAEDIKWTPTVAVYKRGVKVDAFKLSDAQRMKDHLWLHDDDA